MANQRIVGGGVHPDEKVLAPVFPFPRISTFWPTTSLMAIRLVRSSRPRLTSEDFVRLRSSPGPAGDRLTD